MENLDNFKKLSVALIQVTSIAKVFAQRVYRILNSLFSFSDFIL